MAFEQPLEADKVGDNSLISLIRDPIIGTLTWILGESDSSNNKMMMKEDGSHSTEDDLQRGVEDMMLSDDSDTSSHQESRYSLVGGMPRLVHSEVSVGDRNPNAATTGTTTSTMTRVNAEVSLHSNPRIAEKKNLSWSENLIEYMDDEVSLIKMRKASFLRAQVLLSCISFCLDS